MSQTAIRVGGRVVTRDGYYAKIVSITEDARPDAFYQLLVLDVAGVGRREGVHPGDVTPTKTRTVPTEVGKYTGRTLAANRRLQACQRSSAASQRRKKALVFSLLHERVVVRKSNCTTTRKMLGRRTRRALFQAFDCYARAIFSIVHQRDKVVRAIQRWQTQCFDKALCAWSDCVARRKERELQVAMDMHREEADDLTRKLEGEAVSWQANFLEAAAALKEHSTRHQEAMAQVQEHVDAVRGEKMGLETALHEKEHCVQELNWRVAQLTAELEGAQATCSKTKQEAADYAARLKEEVGRSKASIAEAAKQVEARDKEAANLEQHLECLEHQLDTAEHQLHGMHALKEELQQSKQMFSQVSAQAEAYEMAAERHRSEAAGFAAAIDDLQHEIRRLLVTDSADHAVENPQSIVHKHERRRTLSSAPPLHKFASEVASETQTGQTTAVSSQHLSKVANAKQLLKHHLDHKDKEHKGKEEAIQTLIDQLEEARTHIAKLSNTKSQDGHRIQQLEGQVASSIAAAEESNAQIQALKEDVESKMSEIESLHTRSREVESC